MGILLFCRKSLKGVTRKYPPSSQGPDNFGLRHLHRRLIKKEGWALIGQLMFGCQQ